MRLGGVLLVALLVPAATAAADVPAWIGRPVAEVRVELAGEPLRDSAVLDLITTRVGEPLSMLRVRETIEHLVGVGRFEDVRVLAEPVEGRGGAIALRWALAPVLRIRRIEIAGPAAFAASVLRREIGERFGTSPPIARLPDIVSALTAYYAERGYRKPVIEPRLVPGDAADDVTLVLAMDAGPRTTIGAVATRGELPEPAALLLARLGLERGDSYDRPALEARLASYEAELRSRGYYEALVDYSVVFAEDGSTANVTLDVQRGPLIRVVFAGDPLPENRRDALVPIRLERSVDLDLLEDASRNIESFFRQQGHRAAFASYTRETRGAEHVLTFTVSRGPLHQVASVTLTGEALVPRADLAGLLQPSPGEPYTDSRVAAAAAAITQAYRVRGFARAAVRAEVTVLAPEAGSAGDVRPVAVRFIITEGPRTVIGSVTVEGAVEIPETRVRSVMGVTAGQPFSRARLDDDAVAIEQLYRDEGFQDVHATAATELADEGRRVDVRWLIREGPRAIVEHVLVTGNVRTSSDVVRREVVLGPGQPLGEQRVIESQRRLAALGLFRRIRISELAHAATGTRDVLIELEEAPSTTVSYGGGLEAGRRLRRLEPGGPAADRIEIAPRGFFEVSRRNLWGKNRALSLFTRLSFRARDPAVDSTDPTDIGGYGFNEYRLVGTLREPRPFGRAGEGQLTGFLEQAVRSSFNFRRRGVRGEYARRVGRGTTVSGRYTFDHTRLFDEQIRPEDRLLVDRRFPQVRLSTFTASVLRDARTDLLDPERGHVLGLDASVAPRALGSEVGFGRTFTQAFVYRRLPGTNGFVLAAGARLGLAAGFTRTVERLDDEGRPVIGPDGAPMLDEVKEVPASERFFAGGDTTVRGFQLDRLGAENTIDEQGYPAGGNGLVVVNLELRAPYWRSVQMVGFVDAGNVFRRVAELSLLDLRPTAGFGVRYRSPLGPLRVDLGFNLDRRTLGSGVRERGYALHISLGQAF